MKTDHVVGLISNIRDRCHRLILRELAKDGVYDLATSHGSILDELYRHDHLRMNELARRIRRDKSTLTALVDKLVKLGYVARRRVAADGRATEIVLTDRGEKLRPAFERVSEVLMTTAFRGLAQTERESLAIGLEKILQNLRDYSEAKRPVVRQRPTIERRIE